MSEPRATPRSAANAIPVASGASPPVEPLPAAGSTERRLAEVAAVGVMAIWAGNFIVVKSTIPILTPVGYSFLRFLLAGGVLLAICRWREGSIGIPRADALRIVLLGFIGFGAYQLLWPTALSTTSVGNSALLIAATPVFTMLISAGIGADRLGPTRAIGAATAFAGVAIVAASHGFTLDRAALGDGLTVGAATCWAVYVSFGAGVLRRHSPLRTSAWAILAGCVVLGPVGVWQLSTADLSAVGPAQLAAVAYSGLLAGALGNVIVLRGIQLLGPTRITNLQFLPPALAILMAALFLGEPILPTQVVGGAVIVLGVLVARREWRPIRRRAPVGG
jgi:drug/metabolite transporter (DMT)-like permease